MAAIIISDLTGRNEEASELAVKVRDLVGDRLDIVVANAGICKAGRIEDHTVAEFDNLFATNVRAPFFLVQQLRPLLGEGSSVIVTTSPAACVSPGGTRTGWGSLVARLCCDQRRTRDSG